VTPSVRDDVILAVDGLVLREIRPIVVVVDPHSFGSASKPEPLIDKLSSRGIPVVIVEKDANLSEALEKNFTSRAA